MAVDYNCMAMQRPDVIQNMRLWNPELNAATYEQIFMAWWVNVRGPQDPASQFVSLADYAKAIGCVPYVPTIPIPPNTSPGSGGNVAGGPAPITTQLSGAVKWVQDNPLLLLLGLGAAFLVLYKQPGVEFGDKFGK